MEEPPSPPLNSVAFLRDYSDSAVFKVFVYPYFKKETLLAIGPYVLWRLYRHLSTLCHLLNIPSFLQIFSWNEVPGKHDKKLLSYLQEVFKLESIDGYDLKKGDAGEYPTITVNIPSAPTIMIKLDKARDKVLIMSRTSDGKFQELQYEVRHEDQEIWVTERMHIE